MSAAKKELVRKASAYRTLVSALREVAKGERRVIGREVRIENDQARIAKAALRKLCERT